ncbi:bestrophin-2-like isoform X2 [Daphnia pulex]|uniref:bestrophin-2-like isoform X2 n=1 Tax=Daphnia pulex TaxID=6669 RepID=UPI001EDD691D|nr:bestrophin-2-like isoform X2 [Daphnia pulex]
MNNNSTTSEFIKMTSISEGTAVKTDIHGIYRFGGRFKSVLLRWKRSVYQLIWKHMLIYAIVYVSLSILYQFILNEDGKKDFRVLAEHCTGYSRSLNIMIVLGFFTSTTMQRLFNMQITIPGTAKSITMFILSLKPDLPEGPMIIEQYARWQILSWVFTFRLVCKPLSKIYPDLASLQTAGLLTQEEKEIMENPELTNPNTPRPLVVIDWILLLLKETFLKGQYFAEINYMRNVDVVMAFKKSCGNTIKFATQNISPALIQAVILAVYGFGCITLMARNFSKEEAPLSNAMIAYIPLMPGLQVIKKLMTFVSFHPTTQHSFVSLMNIRSSSFTLPGFVLGELQSILSGMTKTISMSNSSYNHTSRIP